MGSYPWVSPLKSRNGEIGTGAEEWRNPGVVHNIGRYYEEDRAFNIFSTFIGKGTLGDHICQSVY